MSDIHATRIEPLLDRPLFGPAIPPLCWVTSAASCTGQVRTENQDAFRLFHHGEERVCLILCDGAGGLPGGKLAAELTAEVLRHQLEALLDRKDAITAEDLLGPVRAARHAVDREKDAGITTAIIAVLQGAWLHFATLGDGGLSITWPGGMVGEALIPHHLLGEDACRIGGYIGDGCRIPPRIGSLRLEPGCTVMAMSDGASDLFPHEVFAEHRAVYTHLLRGGEAPDLADRFLQQLEAARDPETDAWLHRDNMTLLLAHLCATDQETPGDV